jgi:lipocalin
MKNAITREWRAMEGRAVVSFPDESPVRGMLNVTFPAEGPTPFSNYWILRTDYTYAVVVACNPINGTHHRDLYWFLSRGYPVSSNARARSQEIVNNYLSPELIRPTPQSFEACVGRP